MPSSHSPRMPSSRHHPGPALSCCRSHPGAIKPAWSLHAPSHHKERAFCCPLTFGCTTTWLLFTLCSCSVCALLISFLDCVLLWGWILMCFFFSPCGTWLTSQTLSVLSDNPEREGPQAPIFSWAPLSEPLASCCHFWQLQKEAFPPPQSSSSS